MRGRAWIGGLASAMALGTVPLGCGGDDGGRPDDDAAEEHVDADGDAAADIDADADLETESTIEDGRDETTAEEVADDGSEPAPGAPLFAEAAVVAVTIAASGDPADVYYPAPPDLASGAYAFPVAVLLQGAKVDKQHYAGFAATVARYGFVVAVPNHESTTLLGRGLYAEQSEPADVLAQLRAENDDPASPLHGIIDAGRLVLLGHSYGGVAGVNVIRNVCVPPSCSGGFTRPTELAGGAFFGTNMATPVIGTVPDIANAGLPLALVQGTDDSKARPDQARATYEKIQDPPKALVLVSGANHYGLCDVNNPPGADPDGAAPTLDQATAVETAARWSAMFLRARALGDAAAAAYLETIGDPADANVELTQEW